MYETSKELPIFDGGIAVHKDVFVIQYKDSAELIKIHDMGLSNSETLTCIQLWNHEKPALALRRNTSA